MRLLGPFIYLFGKFLWTAGADIPRGGQVSSEHGLISPPRGAKSALALSLPLRRAAEKNEKVRRGVFCCDFRRVADSKCPGSCKREARTLVFLFFNRWPCSLLGHDLHTYDSTGSCSCRSPQSSVFASTLARRTPPAAWTVSTWLNLAPFRA